MIYLKFLGCILIIAFIYVLLVFTINRFHTPKDIEYRKFIGESGKKIEHEIKVTTWNIGYAGMGEESDFFMDLGEQKRPLSSEIVDKNLSGIKDYLASINTDVIFLQEVAGPSVNTYNRDVYKKIQKTLIDYSSAFSPDIHLRFMPPPLNVRVGNAIFTKLQSKKLELRPLALEPTYLAHTFRKTYRMHIMRIDAPEPWIFINVHLSAFDTPEHSVREIQLRQVLDFAQKEYSAGAHVVVGGDWNLRLDPQEFSHTTDKQYQFWIRDLPPNSTPDGWRWAVDSTKPTVRTAQKPYVEGENMTLIVDGFLVSPNVDILDVQTNDLHFRYSDHNPITARLRAHPQK